MRRVKLSYIYLTLLTAYLLILLPWSPTAIQFRPDFILLVLIFWIIREPNLCNIGTAWFVGLMVDLATGSLFGQYAWAYTVSAFVIMIYQRRLVLFGRMNQFIYVFIILITSQLVLLILKTFAGVPFPGLIYFAPSAVGVLLWTLSFMFKLHDDSQSREI